MKYSLARFNCIMIVISFPLQENICTEKSEPYYDATWSKELLYKTKDLPKQLYKFRSFCLSVFIFSHQTILILGLLSYIPFYCETRYLSFPFWPLSLQQEILPFSDSNFSMLNSYHLPMYPTPCIHMLINKLESRQSRCLVGWPNMRQ